MSMTSSGFQRSVTIVRFGSATSASSAPRPMKSWSSRRSSGCAARRRRTPSPRRRRAGCAGGSRTRRAGRPRARPRRAREVPPRARRPARPARRSPATRPGSPSPGANVSDSLSARTPRRSPAARSHAAQPPVAGSTPRRRRPPAERAPDRLQRGLVDLDRPLGFRQDPRDGVLDAPEVARIGDRPPVPSDSLMASGDVTPAEAAPTRALARCASSWPTTTRCCARASRRCSQDAGHEVVGRARDARDLLLKVRSYVPGRRDRRRADAARATRDDGLLAAAEIRAHAPDGLGARALPAPRAGLHARARRRRRLRRRLPAQGPRARRRRVPRRRRARAAGGTAFDPGSSAASSGAAAARRSTSSPSASARSSRSSPRAAPTARSPSSSTSARARSSGTSRRSSRSSAPGHRGRQPPRARRARAARALRRAGRAGVLRGRRRCYLFPAWRHERVTSGWAASAACRARAREVGPSHAKLDTVETPRRSEVRALESEKARAFGPFARVGETGFEPATARPPAGKLSRS